MRIRTPIKIPKPDTERDRQICAIITRNGAKILTVDFEPEERAAKPETVIVNVRGKRLHVNIERLERQGAANAL